MNQALRLALAINSTSAKSSVEDLKQASIGIVSTLNNIQTGLSGFLNDRYPTLDSDFERAKKKPEIYDTDLFDYWNNPSREKF
jgi:hypothetical protein